MGCCGSKDKRVVTPAPETKKDLRSPTKGRVVNKSDPKREKQLKSAEKHMHWRRRKEEPEPGNVEDRGHWPVLKSCV